MKIYEELAYNRKNSLCTHPQKRKKKKNNNKRPNLPLNMEACFSILEVIAHPEGVKSINST